jgi:LmbE family N-acetylglucosaminyl deacetylase
MKKSIFVLAAHPDDDVLGCGGTMARYANDGSAIYVAFLADGVSSRQDAPAGSAIFRSELAARRAAAQTACGILGANVVSFGDFPDNRLDTIAFLDIVKFIEALFRQYRPETVLTHHVGDLNIDHRTAHRAVETACRPLTGSSVKTIASFEVPSSTEWRLAGHSAAFTPNWFVDVSQWLDHKLRAIDAYATEMREWPHPRSRRAVEYLARLRGASVGVDAAEAYMLGRKLS